MAIDIKKILGQPQNEYETALLLISIQQKLIDAIHIMQSMLDNRGDDHWEFHEKRIKSFLNQFEANAKI